jgi:hypothetical protein
MAARERAAKEALVVTVLSNLVCVEIGVVERGGNPWSRSASIVGGAPIDSEAWASLEQKLSAGASLR